MSGRGTRTQRRCGLVGQDHHLGDQLLRRGARALRLFRPVKQAHVGRGAPRALHPKTQVLVRKQARAARLAPGLPQLRRLRNARRSFRLSMPMPRVLMRKQACAARLASGLLQVRRLRYAPRLSRLSVPKRAVHCTSVC